MIIVYDNLNTFVYSFKIMWFKRESNCYQTIHLSIIVLCIVLKLTFSLNTCYRATDGADVNGWPGGDARWRRLSLLSSGRLPQPYRQGTVFCVTNKQVGWFWWIIIIRVLFSRRTFYRCRKRHIRETFFISREHIEMSHMCGFCFCFFEQMNSLF